MALKYRVADLLWAAKTANEVNVIGHGCNCFNTMKSGIAPLIAKAFPGAELEDNRTVRGDIANLGTCTRDTCLESKTIVYNLYSQYRFDGRRKGIMDLDYNALGSALRCMAYSLRAQERILGYERSEWKIGLPKIGAGLAGGDWNKIAPIIEKELAGFDVTIYVLNKKEVPDAGNLITGQ